ncbi:hypothetical protein PAPYR_1336 [Paratrimastix pyriformis]|uniref:F-box domain-containing protein n=1 Tax=Paratrimastix pyriformis TaxID=342808 RepID=A0ABQ8UX65_9EUKA|nr:hypothetical protein PAPYR_1336 [Paratrimastix pyriformis]
MKVMLVVSIPDEPGTDISAREILGKIRESIMPSPALQMLCGGEELADDSKIVCENDQGEKCVKIQVVSRAHQPRSSLCEAIEGLSFLGACCDVILFTIFSHLDDEALATAGAVCRRWHNLTQNEFLWKTISEVRGSSNDAFAKARELSKRILTNSISKDVDKRQTLWLGYKFMLESMVKQMLDTFPHHASSAVSLLNTICRAWWESTSTFEATIYRSETCCPPLFPIDPIAPSLQCPNLLCTCGPEEIDDQARMFGILGDLNDMVAADYPMAEFWYRTAISLKPEDAISHANLGVLLRQVTRCRRCAETEFKRAIQLDPHCWMFHYNLALFFVCALSARRNT